MMEEKKEKTEEKVIKCSICGKPADTVICHACSDKVRGEAVEQKHDINKAGRTGSGRK